jgi:septum formation protein
MKILLASGSQRRLELLSALGHEIVVKPALVVEVIEHEGRTDEQVALVNARLKAHHVFLETGLLGCDILVGADTVVLVSGELLGKAEDQKEASLMLKKLSGQAHVVATGYCLIDKAGREICGLVKSQVEFRALSDQEISSYVASNDWHDKAGAYGIQTLGAALVRKVDGSINNIIGLPIEELVADAKKLLFDAGH